MVRRAPQFVAPIAAAALAGIMRQALALGQRWGQQIGIELDAEARRELKKRGIDH
jgi:hypothetical protein